MAGDVWALAQLSLDQVVSPVMLRVFWELCERAYAPVTREQPGVGQTEVLSAAEAVRRGAGNSSDMRVVSY